jgi:hypothetical protein
MAAGAQKGDAWAFAVHPVLYGTLGEPFVRLSGRDRARIEQRDADVRVVSSRADRARQRGARELRGELVAPDAGAEP